MTGDPLLIGEVFVDFTIMPRGVENKLRLGGVAHAARGFWALGQKFSAAVVVPGYMEELTRNYFAALGCSDFTILGRVTGAPNLTLIFDATEVSDQEYDTPLREEKDVELINIAEALAKSQDVLIFPGSYDLERVCAMLPVGARLHIDAAYDISSPSALISLSKPIDTILTSTSSPWFIESEDQTLDGVAVAFAECNPKYIILKQNRGGTELLDCSGAEHKTTALPAQLGKTINSVGVGDVFAAAFVAELEEGPIVAGWRATYAASAYSQTTYPDIFRKYVERDRSLSINEMISLGGTYLPWSARSKLQIYFAAPDFANANRIAIDEALSSLEYHNFYPRRPVIENGELPPLSSASVLRSTFEKDCALLKRCELVFAVPTDRDPGTLVEIGLAIEAGIPVITYDPDGVNNNTMVMAGSSYYSSDLDACLNALFSLLSKIVSKRS